MESRRLLPAILLLSLCSCRQSDSEMRAPAMTDVVKETVSVTYRGFVPSSPKADDDSLGGPAAPIPASVYAYHRAFQTMLADTGRVDLSRLWKLEDEARVDLMKVMEGLSDSDFARAESLMSFHRLVRHEIVAAFPDIGGFLALARHKGTPEDTTFFSYMDDVQSEGLWKWQQTVVDYSACDQMGSLDLFRSLRLHSEIRSLPPSPYAEHMPDPEKELRARMNYGICACDDRQKTLQAFEANLANTPAYLPERPLLDSIHTLLKQPRPKDRFNCIPG